MLRLTDPESYMMDYIFCLGSCHSHHSDLLEILVLALAVDHMVVIFAHFVGENYLWMLALYHTFQLRLRLYSRYKSHRVRCSMTVQSFLLDTQIWDDVHDVLFFEEICFRICS